MNKRLVFSLQYSVISWISVQVSALSVHEILESTLDPYRRNGVETGWLEIEAVM